MLAVTVLIDNPNVLTGLDTRLPGAVWLGVQDYTATFMKQLSAATPIGWKYKPLELTKKGARQALKGKQLWGMSGAKMKAEKFAKKRSGKWVRSGALRESWEEEADQAARGITISTKLPYIEILERGLYPNPPKGPMPKNVPWTPWRVEGGFSKQAQKGIVGPLLTDQKLERAIDLIVKRIGEMLEGAANG